MWFQDLWTYDFRRTEMCIIPYATQMGEISFCAYNTGVGWRHIVENMHQTATVAEWYANTASMPCMPIRASRAAARRRTAASAENPKERTPGGRSDHPVLGATPKLAQRRSSETAADPLAVPYDNLTRRTDDPYDVLIAGGGLAGLTLARQLRREAPHCACSCAEKRAHPVPEAAFKVGESSVEIGAHYFQNVLDLEPHLREQQLEKFGLRYFFPARRQPRIETASSSEPPVFPRVRRSSSIAAVSRTCCCRRRARPASRSSTLRVSRVELGAPHRLTSVDAGRHARPCRRAGWSTRAAARPAAAARSHPPSTTAPTPLVPLYRARQGRRLVRRRGLAGARAVGAALAEHEPPDGQRLLGVAHSARLRQHQLRHRRRRGLHPYDRLNRFDRALDWLREFEPQCAEVAEAHAGGPRGLSRAAATSPRLRAGAIRRTGGRWSARRGCSPIRSIRPGSDFIAMGNDFIADLIAPRAARRDVTARAEAFNTTYLRLYDAFLRLYEGQYPIMGNAQVMTAKVAWDNACYWAITALLFFQRRYRDPAFMASIEPLMRRFFVLHARMQQFLNTWTESTAHYGAGFTSVVAPEWLRRAAGRARRACALDDDALAGAGWTRTSRARAVRPRAAGARPRGLRGPP